MLSIEGGTRMYFTLKKIAGNYVYIFGAHLPKCAASDPGRLLSSCVSPLDFKLHKTSALTIARTK